jgi:competence protein ComEC
MVLAAAVFCLFLFFFLPFFKKYKYRFTTGIAAMLAFVSLGALLSIKKDIRNTDDWIGHHYKSGDALVFTIDEPLIEKTKSYKTTGQANYVIAAGKSKAVKGKIIFYFQKDSSIRLAYGDKIIFTKPLQEIRNAGNPGGFDYKRYSLFQGITHQVYLKPADYIVLNEKNKSQFKQFIYNGREMVLGILRKYIHGDRELGLAEALLIGYKNDLEQSLVQSYTNTGVVHIIAISGLHLGLIYWLLSLLFSPLKNKKKAKWLRPLFIITGLWLFSFLAGAQPSILRSALMFSCIILGESFSRKTSIYNTIALSAFILLCINPFWLWDVGFQLSYAAVLSIIIFMRPIYNWFYIKNKALDFIWKMNAVTLAAQILTVPLGLYHFHQFPNLFFLTNFLAVPLSSLIVLGEILLCTLSFFPLAANFIGKIIWGMIWLMNIYIEKIESISFSLWDGLQISIVQAVFLLLFAIGISYWLIEKSAIGLKAGLICLLVFISIRSFSFLESNSQQKIIVYNVPQKSAIDFIDGRSYKFVGDSDLLANDFARNFHLKPSRTLLRITDSKWPAGLTVNSHYITYQNKKVLRIDDTVYYDQPDNQPEVDLLIISKTPKLYLRTLSQSIHIKQIVFDSSVPAWKTKYWKADCDSLHIPWHDVSTNGAFVMNLQ